MAFNKIVDRVVRNPILYVIIGTLVAITTARIYVFLGGSVTFESSGIYLHHLFYGVIIVALIGILSFLFSDRIAKHAALNKFMALVFGFGLGLVIDESNLLILTGQEYSLVQYYSAYNVVIEFVVVLLLVAGLAASVLTQTILSRRSRKR